MEPQKLDNQFKKMIESSEKHYQDYSDKAKNFVWHKIQKGDKGSVPSIWIKLAVAATILILLALSMGFYHSKKQSVIMIANLNHQLEQLTKENEGLIQKLITESKIVTIEKDRIVQVPVIKKEIVEKIEYIRDTIIITQLVTENKEIKVEDIKANTNKADSVINREDHIISTEFILSDQPVFLKKQKEGLPIERFLKKRFGHTETINSEPITLMNFLSRL